MQEYCQKKGFPLPKYNTKKIGGFDHEPIFIRKLILKFEKKISVKSKEFSTTIEAEQDAASEALREITINYS
ncbi:MAG: hypothetical protein KGD59_06745 [Candidatus Heimdallarchaeota archaeon]|nr:hypothetical protein [Candidatus Heimdallarchaeota archaeon]MBY8994232.1 hypothetical protein [Candidatus Heimdallarchaeota archaeon]